jgi:hypothetical protein
MPSGNSRTSRTSFDQRGLPPQPSAQLTDAVACPERGSFELSAESATSTDLTRRSAKRAAAEMERNRETTNQRRVRCR